MWHGISSTLTTMQVLLLTKNLVLLYMLIMIIPAITCSEEINYYCNDGYAVIRELPPPRYRGL